jgi:hypothetical protein
MRAWLLRTFRGRPKSSAAWEADPPPLQSAPRASFVLGGLQLTAVLTGLKATGINHPAAVYEVEIVGESRRRWSSRYGLAPAMASPAAAAEHALDELDLIWRERARWQAAVTAGMSEDEVEAMLASPTVEADIAAAAWVGPELDAVRASTRDVAGRWLVSPPRNPPPGRGEG